MMKSIVAGPGEVCLAPYIRATSEGDGVLLHECPVVGRLPCGSLRVLLRGAAFHFIEAQPSCRRLPNHSAYCLVNSAPERKSVPSSTPIAAKRSTIRRRQSRCHAAGAQIQADHIFSQAEQPRREGGADPDVPPRQRGVRKGLVDDCKHAGDDAERK